MGSGDVATKRRERAMARGREKYSAKGKERNIQQRGVHNPRMCCTIKRKNFNFRERKKVSTPRIKR